MSVETHLDQEQEQTRQNSTIQVFSVMMTEDLHPEDNSSAQGIESANTNEGSGSGVGKGRVLEIPSAGEPEKSRATSLPDSLDEYSSDQLTELVQWLTSVGIGEPENKQEKSGSGNEERRRKKVHCSGKTDHKC